MLAFSAFRFLSPDGAGLQTASAGSLEQLQEEVEQNPDSAQALVRLAVASATKHVETGDNGLLKQARTAAERAQALDPENAEVAFAMGLVLLSEHRFAEALEQGRKAVESTPFDDQAVGIVVDSLVELGQYEEAVVTAQDMVDIGPGVASYSRISYIRELHGDVEGAARAMRQAEVSATRAGDQLVVATYAGDLFRGAGMEGEARRHYEKALRLSPGHLPAETGLAQLDLDAGRNDLAEARLRKLDADDIQVATLLGDIHAERGELAAASRLYDVARAGEDENRTAGLNVDVEEASFEAARTAVPGGPSIEEVVELARRGFDERPTLLANDALGWALHKAGRSQEALDHVQQATRLGTRYSRFWFHRAAVEHSVGMVAEARASLGRAREFGAGVDPTDRAEAERLAQTLTVEWP